MKQMSYICDNCGKTGELVPTRSGEYLCRLCMVKKNLKPKIDFCCKCMCITPHDIYVHRKGIKKGMAYMKCQVCKQKTDMKSEYNDKVS